MNKSTLLFIFADIAGHFEAFQKLLLKAPKGALIIVLGDVNDKGPDSAKLIEFLMNHPEIIWLMGNHEHMLYKCYEQVAENKLSKVGYDPFSWLYVNGGLNTLRSYGIDVKIPKVFDDRDLSYYQFKQIYSNLRKNREKDMIDLLKDTDEAKYTIRQIAKLPKDHMDYIKKLPLSFSNDEVFCSHAHLKQENMPEHLSLTKMDEKEDSLNNGVLWSRAVPKRPRKDKKFIIYGHMNVENVFCHTPKHPKGSYSRTNEIVPNSFGVCFDLTSQGSLLVAMEWPAKTIHTEPIKWED